MSNISSSAAVSGKGVGSRLVKLFVYANAVSAWIIFLLMFLTVADITGRRFFNAPVPGTFEVTEAVMSFVVFLAFAYTEAAHQNIRVELLTHRLPERWRELSSILACLAGIALFGMIFWGSAQHAVYSISIRETTQGQPILPLYPSKLVVPLGAALLLAQFVMDLVRKSVRLWSWAEGQ